MYQQIMGTNPSKFKNCGSCPVENVSYNDINKFLQKLNDEAKGRYKYRLPTEAEWEYAAKANVSFLYAGGESPQDIAWYITNSKNGTQKVATKSKNAFGLYDMSGNVSEWTANRTVKGGSWKETANSLEITKKDNPPIDRPEPWIGFRIIREEIK
jgi:formylglycine-generating enzyme required for sulfatase activity